MFFLFWLCIGPFPGVRSLAEGAWSRLAARRMALRLMVPKNGRSNAVQRSFNIDSILNER
jgi:hypothetical protein